MTRVAHYGYDIERMFCTITTRHFTELIFKICFRSDVTE
jgi:hypothetical protein